MYKNSKCVFICYAGNEAYTTLGDNCELLHNLEEQSNGLCTVYEREHNKKEQDRYSKLIHMINSVISYNRGF